MQRERYCNDSVSLFVLHFKKYICKYLCNTIVSLSVFGLPPSQVSEYMYGTKQINLYPLAIRQILFTRVTSHVSLVEQELLTLLEHTSSLPIFLGFVLFNLCFSLQCPVDHCLSYCHFLFLAIAFIISIFTTSDYPLGYYQTLCSTN